MININLVPEELVKRKKYRLFHRAVQAIPLEISIGIVGGFLAFLFIVNIVLQLTIFVQMGTCKAIEVSLAGIGPQRTEVNAVLAELKVLRQKISTIESVTTGKRLSWSQKLNAVSDAMTPGAWLARMTLTKESFVMEGSVVSKKGDYANIVNTFSANLRSNSSFMKGLKDPDMNFTGRRRVNTTEIANFVLRLQVGGK